MLGIAADIGNILVRSPSRKSPSLHSMCLVLVVGLGFFFSFFLWQILSFPAESSRPLGRYIEVCQDDGSLDFRVQDLDLGFISEIWEKTGSFACP